DELMIITAKGIMLRTDLADIREIGRATQGVRMIRPDEGDRVVAVAKIAAEQHDEDEDAADVIGDQASDSEEASAEPGGSDAPSNPAAPPPHEDASGQDN
ncbi:MAG TPA: DNA gyrase C-terminal beta-propeller domain-containing protein, partial [Phycisphaerae bacterium]|nr:DNA gyrase C-terminal beta-propeller domain-containing protein [Phycisphaerae bacterium]